MKKYCSNVFIRIFALYQLVMKKQQHKKQSKASMFASANMKGLSK